MMSAIFSLRIMRGYTEAIRNLRPSTSSGSTLRVGSVPT
jgi:hypothetical protein